MKRIVMLFNNAGAMSQATLTSEWAEVDGRNFSIQYSWTDVDNPIGTVSFEVSNDGVLAEPVDSSLFSPSLEHPNATPDSHIASFTDFHVQKVRAKYTRTSGGTGDTFSAAVKVA